MANSFGFQFDERTLRDALGKIEQLKREYDPAGEYVLQFSVNLLPDGVGYVAYGMTLLVIDARLQEADTVTVEQVSPMTYVEAEHAI